MSTSLTAPGRRPDDGPQASFSTRSADAAFDPRFLYEVVAKRRWLILAVVVTVVSLTLLQTVTTTPLYRSTVKLQIDPEDSNVLPYEEVYGGGHDLYSAESYLQTQHAVLRSDTLALRTLRRLDLADSAVFNFEPRYGVLLDTARGVVTAALGLFADPPKEESETALVDRFLDQLEVSPIRNTRLVEVSFTSVDPDFSRLVVDTLAEEFVEYNFESRYDATTRATDFLQRQLEDLKIRVEKSEEELIEYAQSKNILNINEQDNTVLQMLRSLNEEMARVQAQLIAETARYRALEEMPEGSFPETLKHEGVVALEKRRAELEQQLARLQQQFLPGWPEIVQTREELATVSRQLEEERSRALVQAQINFEVALDHYNRLRGALGEQEARADRLQQNSIQYNILKREVETNKQLYEGLLQRLKEAGVSAGLRSSNISVVDAGRLPDQPAWPDKRLHLLLGLLLGTVLGISLAFSLEYLDNTLKTPDEIEEYLSLPSLGVIPTLEATRRREKVGNAPSGSLLAFFQPQSRMWEAYRSLRTSLLLSQSERPPKRILITSAFAGEGKTTTVANMGIVLAQTGARVVLIDLDMRRSTLAGLFGLQPETGMSSYLSGNSRLSEQLRQTGIPNLYLLPAGPHPPNAAELIGSERMERVFQLLEEDFDFMVIDSPPVLSVTDAQILSTGVEGVMLVVQGGKTPRNAVSKAIQRLSSVGGNVLGAMVNKVDIYRSEYSYYYRYYYDDRYYQSNS